MNCGNTCGKLFTRESHQKFIAQGFYGELVTQIPSAQHVAKFQTPRKYKPYHLYKHSKNSKTFLSFKDKSYQCRNCLPATTLAKRQLTNSLPKDSSLQSATLTIFCTLTILNGQTDLNFSCSSLVRLEPRQTLVAVPSLQPLLLQQHQQ